MITDGTLRCCSIPPRCAQRYRCADLLHAPFIPLRVLLIVAGGVHERPFVTVQFPRNFTVARCYVEYTPHRWWWNLRYLGDLDDVGVHRFVA